MTGIVLGRDRLGQPWLTVSMTLSIVAFALLFAMVQRDQRTAVKVMAAAQADEVESANAETVVADTGENAPTASAEDESAAAAETKETREPKEKPSTNVQTGRIAAFSGVIALLWLVILVFMVWQPGA